jgi:Double zinc ribbon
MRCPRCASENPEDIKFCEQCGAPFTRRCARCRFENSPAAKFCGDCGEPLRTPTAGASANKSPGAPIRVADSSVSENLEGERKTVTALFADIKGSTELEEDLDPEEARAIVDPALKALLDELYR